MSRKTKIIFIVLLVFIVSMIVGIYFYNKNKNVPDAGDKTSFYQKFNPFGTGKTVDNTGDNTGTEVENTNTTDENIVSNFTKLTDFAVSGATYFEEEENTVNTNEVIPSLRYVERATGHIYQMNLQTKEKGKISNSTIPGVYEAIFDGKGSSVIYRYVSSGEKTITSFLATLAGKSNFLNSDILEVSLSPDKNKFFSIIKNSSGVTGVTKSFEETKTNQVWSSSFSEWLPQWVTEQSIFLTTKPSYLVDGSVFVLNTTNGTLSKIFGEVKGLTTLANKTGTNILYSASLNNGPKLNIFNVQNHTSKDLNFYGLPEKCIWSSDNINVYCATPETIVGNQYPDFWYQGLVSFNDFFIKINTETGKTSTLENSNDEPIDMIKPFFNKDETKLFFINKKDYTLWQLDL